MKTSIELFDYAGHILKATKKGVLLTTAANGKVNTMTIGWGALGIQWNRPIFIAYVRESRYTKALLEENGAFTVNIPLEAADPSILKVCGTKSGRDCDKIAQLGLTLEEPQVINVPGIRELPLTIECRVIYKQPEPTDTMPQDILDRFYPVEDNGIRDAHIAYYGEVVAAYIITE